MFFQEHEADAQHNWVGQLQELATKSGWAPPQYEEVSCTGKPHERVFGIKCTIRDDTAIWYGARKKLAKQRAAQQLLQEEETVCKEQKHE